MSKIVFSRKDGIVFVYTPYHPDFPSAARDMGGQWRSPAWVFDARDEKRVRDFCLDLFGTDGSPCELVTLRVTLSGSVCDRAGKETEIYIGGRRCAWVFGNDDNRARLGYGVVLVEGRLFGSGSRRNPNISWSDGTTVLEVRDVPRVKAEQVLARNPELIYIIGSPVSPAPENVQVSPEVQALIDKRDRLTALLAEIDAALLKSVPAQREVPVFEVADELLDND